MVLFRDIPHVLPLLELTRLSNCMSAASPAEKVLPLLELTRLSNAAGVLLCRIGVLPLLELTRLSNLSHGHKTFDSFYHYLN